MSRLDNIVIECVNKALDQKEEKLGDYIDPTKQQIQRLMLELIGEDMINLKGSPAKTWMNRYKAELRKKVEEL